MQVDVTALLQGVYHARKNNPASCTILAQDIITLVDGLAYRGPVGREVIDYHKFMVGLSTIESDWISWAFMWQELGESLSSGITVAENNK